MKFQKLIPNLYYTDISKGLRMFRDCLGFEITHDEIGADQPFCVISRDGLSFFLFQHEALAREHSPEFRFVTENIEEVYEKVSHSHPEYLHPNLSKVTLRPWGAREFALRDEQVCLIFQQW